VTGQREPHVEFAQWRELADLSLQTLRFLEPEAERHKHRRGPKPRVDAGMLLLNTLFSLLAWPLEACLARLREQEDLSPRLRALLESPELDERNPRGFLASLPLLREAVRQGGLFVPVYDRRVSHIEFWLPVTARDPDAELADWEFLMTFTRLRQVVHDLLELVSHVSEPPKLAKKRGQRFRNE